MRKYEHTGAKDLEVWPEEQDTKPRFVLERSGFAPVVRRKARFVLIMMSHLSFCPRQSNAENDFNAPNVESVPYASDYA